MRVRYFSLKQGNAQGEWIGKSVKPSQWTGVGGVVVGMFLLSHGFGFIDLSHK
jgi:hypothetical protein